MRSGHSPSSSLRLVLVALPLVAAGCGDGDGGAAPSGSGAPGGAVTVTAAATGAGAKGNGQSAGAEANGPFSLTVDGTATPYPNAYIRPGFQYDTLMLTTKPVTCDDLYAGDGARIEVSVPLGPGEKRGAGKPVSGEATFRQGTKEIPPKWVPAYSITLDLQGYEPKNGTTARGTLTIDSTRQVDGKAVVTKGAGRFEAKVCGDAPPPQYALPEAAAEGPVAGNFEGKKFTAKSGLAFVVKEADSGIEYLGDVEFYPVEGMTCDKVSAHFQANGEVFRMTGLSAVTNRRALGWSSGVPFFNEGATNHGFGAGWVRFDEADLRAGGKVKGSLYAADEKSKFSGQFDVTVCVK